MSEGIRSVFHQYIEKVFDDIQLEVIRRSLQWTDGATKVPVQIDAEFRVDANGLAVVEIKGTKIAQAVPGWDAAINIVGQMALFSEGEPAAVPVPAPPPTREVPSQASEPEESAFAPNVTSITNSPRAVPAEPERMIPEEELEEPGISTDPLAGLVLDDELAPVEPAEEGEEELTPAEQRLQVLEARNKRILAQGERSGSQLSPEAQEALKRRAKKAK